MELLVVLIIWCLYCHFFVKPYEARKKMEVKKKKRKKKHSYEGQKKVLADLPAKGSFWARIFYSNYAKYCHSQEKRTPEFQKFFKQWNGMADKEEYKEKRELVKNEFLAGSRPLMPYTNLLTFNLRAIVCYVSCLINHPWIYPMFEIVVMSFMYIYMHSKHEKLCASLIEKLK